MCFAVKGLYGYRKNGVDKLNKCGNDAYPMSLGNVIVDRIRSKTISQLHYEYHSKPKMTKKNMEFIHSPYCKWVYIINLDTNKLEIWASIFRSGVEQNRYYNSKFGGSIKLLMEFDINNIPDNWLSLLSTIFYNREHER